MNGSCISHERCMQVGKKNISKFSSLYVSKPKIVKTNILSTRNLKKKAKANFRYFHVFCEWAQKISEKKKCLLLRTIHETFPHNNFHLSKRKKLNIICLIFYFFRNIIQKKNIFICHEISTMKFLDLNDIYFIYVY